MSANLKRYFTTIENTLKAGNATEHTHRPALKDLLESLDSNIIATNEPKRIACGAPDYIVTRDQLTIGYIEAKDVGKSLNEAERSDQLKRYRRALGNLILTDYLEFRWYVDGELRQEARLAKPQSVGKLKLEKEGVHSVGLLLESFLNHQPQEITSPKDLAERMARLTHIIRDIIIAAFASKQASMLLEGWRDAFAKVLIAELALPDKTPDFADMFAQTLAYGLFSARVMDTSSKAFTRQEAQYLIPKSNPFLRDFFIQITGPQLDDEPFVSFVNDLANLLGNTDMEAVLTDFGRRTMQEDPVVHFYETFLAAYDPRLREARGVYYTPEPVVSYIVRSVDQLIKSHFNCPQGLADNSEITIPNINPSVTVKGKNQPRKTIKSHNVLVLDPATGTGTFLYAVVDHIRKQFMERGNAGMWPGYVKKHLLPRLFGFELLMAPYAIAHFKLSLQLAGRDLPDILAEQWAYHPSDGERLGIYLTNTLEEPHEMTGLPLFTQWVADETNAANEVKRTLPVLVVMGNPPYSGQSANNGQWIVNLLKGKLPDGGKTANYYEVDGQPLGERNSKWLRDDYVKFIRFGQWRIENSGAGILAFISNNGYLDNPTFRGMRQSLMKTFSDIYILDLHGSSKKKETTPDGGNDENVFDIQQGVAIGIFVKDSMKTGNANVFHSSLWGIRADKYRQLFEDAVDTTNWQKLSPQSPFYLFSPQNTDHLAEYQDWWQVTHIFPLNSVGLVTARDHFTIHWTESSVWETVTSFVSQTPDEAREAYRLGRDVRDWKVHLAQADIASSGPMQELIVPILYRPFDVRFTYYTGHSRGFICMPRPNVMRHLLAGSNMALITSRLTKGEAYKHAQVTRNIAEVICMSPKTSNNGFVFPMYLYPSKNSATQQTLLDVSPWPGDVANGGRTPNLSLDFVSDLEQRLDLTFVPQSGISDLSTSFDTEDIFHYIYAIFHSPTYRARYAEFLRTDFPRVPLSSDTEVFRALCAIGKKLIGLHLLESPEVSEYTTHYPITGDNRIENGYPQYTPPKDGQQGRIAINKTQYFVGIPPEVWDFQIGGYQVMNK